MLAALNHTLAAKNGKILMVMYFDGNGAETPRLSMANHWNLLLLLLLFTAHEEEVEVDEFPVDPNVRKFASISNFSCSLTKNITPHSMKNLAFHNFLR